MRRVVLLIAAAIALSLTGVGAADAAPSSKSAAARKGKVTSKATGKKRGKAKATTRECKVVKGKRKCRRVAMFSGHGAPRSSLRTEPLAKPSGNVWLYAENLREEVKVNIYKKDGSFDDAALAKLDEVMRCRQTGEVRAVRRDLYEQLSRIYDHFGGDKRIELISGFRFAERSSSRHYHASAMDIRIKGVSIRDMYRYAESLDGGDMGIGLYPTSNFIHVDFRAPGEPSYRWTDRSGPGSGKKAKGKKSKRPKNRTQPARKPVS